MESSQTASGLSYVGRIDSQNSNVQISGVYVPKKANYKLRVFYANAGDKSSHRLLVNNLHTVVVSYPKTSAGWGQFSDETFVETTVPLLAGNNVLRFAHDSNYAELDKIEIIT